MKCSYCGSDVPQDAQFCNSCGSPMEAEPTQPPVPEQTPVTDQTPVTEQIPVAEPVWASATAPVSSFSKPKLPKKKLLTVLICALAAIVLVVTAGLLTNWFGLVGPVDQIATATSKTLGAKSITISGTVYREYPEYRWNYDTNEDEFVGMKTMEGTLFLQIVIDKKEEDIMLYGTLEDETGTQEIAIYDGYAITFYDDGTCDYDDCSDDIKDFFEGQEDAKKALKELRKVKPDYEDAIDDLFGRGTYDDMSDVIEFDELKSCFRAVHRKINKRSWLKKNFDYSTKLSGGAKIHSFHVESLDFLEDLLPLVEPLFAKRADYRAAEDNLEDIGDAELDIELRLGVKGGKLSLLEIDAFSSQGEHDVVTSISFEFSKIGRTKLDTKELEELLDEAIEYEDQDFDSTYDSTYDYTYDSTYDYTYG